MVHGFDDHRVFISAPGDLTRERDATRAAISEVNEKQAMPHKILLVSVGLTEDAQIINFRAAASENVRQAAYFIQIFQDDWGPQRLFRKLFHLSLDCREDPAMKMREVVVCVKAAPREDDPEILGFRKELEECPGVRVVHFQNPDDLKGQLVPVCSDWVRSIREAAAQATGS